MFILIFAIIAIFVFFLPLLLFPFLKFQQLDFSERFYACVFKHEEEWYAYYCPGGKYDAVSVGPCVNKKNALGALVAISKCDNILYLSKFIFTKMPTNLPKKPDVELSEGEASKYSTLIPFHKALGTWGDGIYPTISSLENNSEHKKEVD